MGRHNFGYVWRRRKSGYRLDWKLIATDTLMPIVCAVIGHRIWDSAMGYGPPSWACKRCFRYVPAEQITLREWARKEVSDVER